MNNWSENGICPPAFRKLIAFIVWSYAHSCNSVERIQKLLRVRYSAPYSLGRKAPGFPYNCRRNLSVSILLEGTPTNTSMARLRLILLVWLGLSYPTWI